MYQIIRFGVLKPTPSKGSKKIWFSLQEHLKLWYQHFMKLPLQTRLILLVLMIVVAVIIVVYILHLCNHMVSRKIHRSEITNRTQHDREIQDRIERENQQRAEEERQATRQPYRFKLMELIYQLFH